MRTPMLGPPHPQPIGRELTAHKHHSLYFLRGDTLRLRLGSGLGPYLDPRLYFLRGDTRKRSLT